MGSSSSAKKIFIFVKYPTPGAVKTRLAADIGPLPASQLYRSCAEHTLKVACRCSGAGITVAYAPVDRSQADYHTIEQQMRLWLNPMESGCSYLQQISDKDLGRRMAAAMERALANGAQKVVLIGSDCPDVDEHILLRAFAALDDHNIVFGPALDGGYYLVGVNRTPGEIFQGIQWSTSTVLHQNLRQAQALGWSCAALPTLPALQDLDTLQDVMAWVDTSSTEHPLLKPCREMLDAHKLRWEN